MPFINAILVATLCIGSAYAQAQTDPLGAGKNTRQVIAMGLYPPDIIMRHQQQLDITDAQRREILQAVKAFQSEVAELQWNLQNEQQLMRQSLSGYEIDAARVVPEIEQVLAMESEFKLAHFRLLITIKNALTEEQIDTINKRIEQRKAQR
ncbi:MAG: hypothetical protein AAGA91_10215 [Pseudomonadota bacterium]